MPDERAILSEPGFYDLTEADYRADPAPRPSLTQSLGQVLLEKCPKAAWWQHPLLNPEYEPQANGILDGGTVRHCLMLGKGKPFKIVDAADYRTKDARLQRDTYRAAGYVPILIEQFKAANAMAAAAREQLQAIEGGKYAFDAAFGGIELCALAYDPAGCWIRTLIDFYGSKIPTGVELWDYKTTSASASPIDLRTRIEGWAFQAAFQERIVCQLKPELEGRLTFRFLVQETQAPYLCSVVTPAGNARHLAHKKVAAAIQIWASCLATDTWPGYSRNPVSLGVLPNAEARWLDREIGDDLIRMAASDPYLATAFPEPDREALTQQVMRLNRKRGPYRPPKEGDKRRREYREARKEEL